MPNGIGKNPLNDISKVYLQTVRESYKVEPPQEKLKTDRDMFNIPKDEQKAAKERLLAKAAAKREKMKVEALDPVGKEDGDVDNDGDKDKSDNYLLKRRKAISKAMKTRKEEIEVEEGYKELSRDKRNKMFRKAGNLSRTALQGGDEGTEAGKKSGKIVKALNKDAEKYNRNDVKNEEVEQVDENRRAAAAAGGYKDDSKKQTDPSKDGFTGISGSIKDIMRQNKEIEKRNKMKKESYSSWRTDLIEVIDDVEPDRKIKEKKVKNKVTINPKLGEAIQEIGGTLIESIKEEDFDDIIESVYLELVGEGYSNDDVEEAIEFALTEQLNEVSDSYYDSAVKASKDADAKNKRAEMMKRVKGRLKFMKRRAGEVAGKVKKKAATAAVNVAFAGDAAKEKVKSAASTAKKRVADAPKVAKAGIKSRIKKAALGVAKRMSEDTEDLQEIPLIPVVAGGAAAIGGAAALMNKIKKAGSTHSDSSVGKPTIQGAASGMRNRNAALQKAMQQLRQSHEPEGEMVEETEDSLRDRRMERGGVDGNNRYKSAPKNVAMGGGKKKPYDGMSALEKVKASIRAKHGEGAIMDTKKK